MVGKIVRYGFVFLVGLFIMTWINNSDSPSRLDQYDMFGKLVSIFIVFGIFALIFWSSLVTAHRMGNPNIYYVSKDDIKRLDAQDDDVVPPEIEKEESDGRQSSKTESSDKETSELLPRVQKHRGGDSSATPDESVAGCDSSVSILMSYLCIEIEPDSDSRTRDRKS